MLALAAAAPSCLAEAGLIQFVNGEAYIVRAAGGERVAQKGLQLDEGDTVVTRRGASMQLRMADQGLIAIRPDTRLKIETYRYSGAEDGSERGVLGLVRGGFRTLTGVIGRKNKQNYLVTTPTATIGIRGTDHEVVHIPAPSPGEVPLGTPGTYNKVNLGETYVQTRGGRIELSSNQVGFAGLPGGVPVKLDSIPSFLRATPLQTGRDERRQPREAGQNDQRRIAVQQSQPGETAGKGGQPGAVQGGPGQGRQPGAEPGGTGQGGYGQGGLGQGGFAQGPGQIGVPNDVKPILAPKTSDGAISFASVATALTPAPLGFAGVGGDNSSGALGSGAMVVTASGSSILFGADGQPAVVADVTGFRYARSGAPLVDSGGALLNDNGALVPVKWGVYAGGAIVDSQGSRQSNFFHFMSAQSTPLAVAATLSGTYSGVFGQTKLITEGGNPGGSVTSANITLNTGKLTAYSIGVTDSQARNWSAGCPTCTGGVALSQFAKQGVALSGTGPGGGASGNAQGIPIGPSGAGVISSFNLKTTAGQGVTGSFAVK